MPEKLFNGHVNVCPKCGYPFPDEINLTPRHLRNKKKCNGSGEKLKSKETIPVRPRGGGVTFFNK